MHARASSRPLWSLTITEASGLIQTGKMSPVDLVEAFLARIDAVDGKIRSFIQQIRSKPQVMDVYFLAGADDFILHVAARDTDDLRSFVVENLNADADVAGTQTSLIFEHLRGASPL